jgi:tRNA threonylcarbamoyladenosine biosynthesis protein TsaE
MTDEPREFLARDEDDTEALGRSLAAGLRKDGGIVALVGTLGAGKTRLVQSIAAALGADRRLVTSPTFILIQEYAADLPIYHFDTYRLRDAAEFLNLGTDEIFEGAGVCLIEWADRVAAVLPSDYLRIEIDVVGPTSRRFHIAARGPKSVAMLRNLQLHGEHTATQAGRDGGSPL